MTSYKKVAKYKYTKNPSDVVALKEYILYEDEKNGMRHAVLKFFNNLDQSLFGLQFEVYQYDGGDNLIAKSLVVCDKFTADAGTEFVPKAKLKLSINCESIGVKLISADFDRIRWDKGNFVDNSYKFSRYVQEAKPAVEPRGEQIAVAPQEPSKPTKKGKQKKIVSFAMRDIYSKNMAKFPKIFTAIVVVLVLAFTVATSVWFTRSSNRFSVGEFDISVNGNTAVLMGYDGDEKDVVIPLDVDGYRITAIAKGAFHKSDIESVEISGNGISVASGAFFRCANLKSVIALGSVTVLERGFEECSEIVSVSMPFGTVGKDSFFGSYKLLDGHRDVGKITADSWYEVVGKEEEKDKE